MFLKKTNRINLYEIIAAKGAISYSIALSLVKITRCILRNENSILPVSTLINEYYQINDVCISLPSLVNRNGVEHYLDLELSELEQKQFAHSANTLKNIINELDV